MPVRSSTRFGDGSRHRRRALRHHHRSIRLRRDDRRRAAAWARVSAPAACQAHAGISCRTWGWSVAFPDDTRPPFARLFRVRLAADAISFFTIRGITGEPLKVMLLYDRVPPPSRRPRSRWSDSPSRSCRSSSPVSSPTVAVRRLAMPGAWDARLHAAFDGDRDCMLGDPRGDRASPSGGLPRQARDSTRAAASAGRSKRRASSASCSTSRTCCSICCAAIAAG